MSEQIRPIAPSEVKKSIPSFVIEAVNELISEKYKPNVRFIIRQNEIKERVMSKTEQDFDYSWLDIEDVYRESGWLVEYDKPRYNEQYDAFFEFKRK